MLIHMLKSKIHRIAVTECNVSYTGSITIDADLLQKANIFPYEKVQVVNITNGMRMETYAIPGKSGEICMNGGMARNCVLGDVVTILSYSVLDAKEAQSHHPVFIKGGY